MSLLQKIADIEEEIARTQKNKATNGGRGRTAAPGASRLTLPRGRSDGGRRRFEGARTRWASSGWCCCSCEYDASLWRRRGGPTTVAVAAHRYLAGHLGLLKAKIAKLKSEVVAGPKGGGAKPGDGFDVTKSGDVRIGMVCSSGAGWGLRPRSPAVSARHPTLTSGRLTTSRRSASRLVRCAA